MNKNTNAIAVVVAFGFIGLVTLISGTDSQFAGVIIHSASNTSLCIRTRSNTSEAAVMKLEDCERPKDEYDGQKVLYQHWMETTRHMSTMWQWADDSDDGYGISGGCLFSQDGYIRVNDKCPQNGSWEFPLVPQNDTLRLWRNLEGGDCVRAPQIQDFVIVEMKACDVNDVNQQWLIEFLL